MRTRYALLALASALLSLNITCVKPTTSAPAITLQTNPAVVGCAYGLQTSTFTITGNTSTTHSITLHYAAAGPGFVGATCPGYQPLTQPVTLTGQNMTVTIGPLVSTTPPPQPPPPPAPSVSLTCNGAPSCSIPYQTTATIAWSSIAATSCSISPGGASGTSGSLTTPALTSSQSYTATCPGPGGSATASVTVTVAPPPVPSALSVSPTTQSIPYTGMVGQDVSVTANVPWTASSDATWLAITAVSSGSGNGSVSYNVAANASQVALVGHINVAGGRLTAQLTITEAAAPAPPPPPPGGLPLVQATSLTYSYSFRLPSNPNPSCGDPCSFNYGGNAAGIPAAFNPNGNGGQGSLLIAGKIENGMAGEVSIPAAVPGATTLAQLPTATVVSPSGQLFDPTGGHRTDVGQGQDFLGGFLYWSGKLITSVLAYYDGSGAALISHIISDGTTYAYQSGPWQVGTLGAGWVAGAMALTPPALLQALGGPALTGLCCLSIVSRTSEGPSLSVFDPSTLGVTTPAPAKRLLGYPSCNTGSDSCGTESLGDWAGGAGSNGLQLFNGAAWYPAMLVIDGTALFCGHLGVGTLGYGISTTNPALGGQPGAPDSAFPNWVYDPTVPDKSGPGVFDSAYQNECLAYDLANDLAAVNTGTKQPWQVLPYASWSITLPITPNSQGLAGAAYDPATRRVFFLEAFGDGVTPLVHVYQVAAGQ